MKRMGKNLGIVARINFVCIVLVATICYDPNQLICSAGVLSPPPPTTTSTTSTGGGGGVSYKDRIIGCLYSDVCPEDQVCFDDHAFGRCEQYDPKTETFTSDYIYELDRKTLQLLESEWQRLNHQGFYWSHPYTQCILKVILNDRPRSRYDPEQCEQYLKVDKPDDIRRQSSENFDEKNNGGNEKQQRQQRQPKLLLPNQVSSLPAKSDDDLFMNIEQTLSKYLVPYDGPSSLSVAETSRPFRKPQPIEKQQQQRRQQQQHQNELNKESLPLISLFPPQASPQAQPPPPPAVSVSSSSSSSKKSSSSTKNSQTSTPSSGKHIDMLQLFPVLFRNNDQHDDDDEDGYNDDDNFDLDKNRELLDYLQDMINNGNYNGDDDGQIDGLKEFPGISKNDVNLDPQQEEEQEQEQEEELQGNYVPNKNLMKTTTTFHHDIVNDFTGGNSNEFQKQEEFNDPQLIETLFHDTDIIGDHHYGNDLGDDRGAGLKQAKHYQQQQSSPLMSILRTIPEIRIIRDTEDINTNMDPFDLTLIDTSSTATVDDPDPEDGGHHQVDDDHDVILLDLDDNDDRAADDDNDNSGGGYTFRNPELEDLDLDYGDLLLLNQILNGQLIKDDGDGLEQQEDAGDDHDHGDDGHMMVSGEDGQKQQQDDDDDDRKEILIGDINYSNNYLLPNFYRNHRYDIKKPGPIFLEDYILENLSSSKRDPDSDDESSAADMVQNAAAILRSNQANNGGLSDNVLTKKDFSIRSQQPVAEGPVKLDSAASKDQLIIRMATTGEKTDLEAIDSTHAYVVIDQMLGEEDSGSFLQTIEQLFNLPRGTFSNLRKEDYQITFKVNPNYQELNASQVATRIEDSAKLIQDITGYVVKETGIGDRTKLPVVSARQWQQSNDQILRMTLLVTTIILSIISAAFVVYLFRRNVKFREKIKGFMKLSEDWIKFDYQDLCRQRFRNKTTDGNNKNSSAASDPNVDVEKKEPSNNNKAADRSAAAAMKNVESGSQHGGSQHDNNQGTNPPSRSSTSSYVEEPVSTNMDITTGHIILSYMEDHLKRKDRLDQEWEALCTYEADPCSCNAALQKQNASKNRYPNVLPYDHSRVILNDGANVSNSDYINANTITDHDPRNPAYIATQGPLPNTKADFWQMIWEQGSVLIVMLTRLRENGLNMCERYWPEEGSEVYGNFEVHLVSEHIWCDDYLVRSFYLKNLKTGETRTVTQFHYLSWPEMGVPQSIKSLLDFRRKVNKSYKGRSCPIVVHCNDGVGRTGTYILIDMVLNRLAKGAKEIDLAASLEHIRDQRGGMVKTKQQFEFVLSAVADEVQAILKTLPN